ncbi:LysR substrate-binding domain-containing protein [uncultured Pseudacidovorax sp.]|uniref:LysR substrate-binding domain-containing protein n=1 Tax=uncultured Pseudacidovorax sp. TaxID=679313 RepID=UPI0025F5FD41|nr:LysR substrate-binding domain-containing protein [uncultured Pseudacidovorax sp.]
MQARISSQGIGIAVLPQVMGKQLGGLRRLSLPEEPPAREIWMGYRDLRRLNRLRTFIAMVNEHLAGLQGVSCVCLLRSWCQRHRAKMAVRR